MTCEPGVRRESVVRAMVSAARSAEKRGGAELGSMSSAVRQTPLTATLSPVRKRPAMAGAAMVIAVMSPIQQRPIGKALRRVPGMDDAQGLRPTVRQDAPLQSVVDHVIEYLEDEDSDDALKREKDHCFETQGDGDREIERG